MIYEDRKSSDIEKKARRIQGSTFLLEDIDNTILETISYKYPKNKIVVELDTSEFTCICPFSSLPDFANLTITYIPRKKLIELKSLKYYLYSFRNVKVYNEHVVNKILLDLKKALYPYELTVKAEFTVRGGIKNKVVASYRAKK